MAFQDTMGFAPQDEPFDDTTIQSDFGSTQVTDWREVQDYLPQLPGYRRNHKPAARRKQTLMLKSVAYVVVWPFHSMGR